MEVRPSRGRRRTVVFAVLALALLGATLAALLTAGGDDDRLTGAEWAVRTCESLAELRNAVASNEPADDVLAVATEARDAGFAAARRDVRYMTLAAAASTVHRSLEEDDADAARAGVDVATAECAAVGRPLTGEEPPPSTSA